MTLVSFSWHYYVSIATLLPAKNTLKFSFQYLYFKNGVVQPFFTTNFDKQDKMQLHLLADKWLSASDERKNAEMGSIRCFYYASLFCLFSPNHTAVRNLFI